MNTMKSLVYVQTLPWSLFQAFSSWMHTSHFSTLSFQLLPLFLRVGKAFLLFVAWREFRTCSKGSGMLFCALDVKNSWTRVEWQKDTSIRSLGSTVSRESSVNILLKHHCLGHEASREGVRRWCCIFSPALLASQPSGVHYFTVK